MRKQRKIKKTEEENAETVKPEKKDWVAMYIAAMYTLFLPCVLIIAFLVILALLIFRVI
ncbi:MAG: hypothetical protein SO203_02295 [Eubacteriales bacterium]|nr:hypothetical protein [Eubacteriales bacterium]